MEPRFRLGGVVGRALRRHRDMKTTRYFDEQVRRKRPCIDLQQCAKVVAAPLRRVEQADGRIRFWGEVVRPGESGTRILRVVTLDDGETVHNAFFDRGFRKDDP